jgi:hypothetical protein
VVAFYIKTYTKLEVYKSGGTKMSNNISLVRPISRVLYGIISLVFGVSIFCSVYSTVYADNYYRWVDKDGVTHMSNYPVDGSQQEGNEITEKQFNESKSSPSDTRKFVAKSREWLRPGIKDIATTVEITYQKNNVYNVNIINDKEVRPFSVVEPDDVIFFSYCVANHFASKKGFNGWRMLKDDVSGEKKVTGKQGMQYSMALGIGGPRVSVDMRNNCSRFIRPEFLWQEIPIERVLKDSTNKPICRRFLEMRLDRDEYLRSIHQKNSQTIKGNNNFQYFLDIDKNGKMDEVLESIKLESGKIMTHLEIKCAGNPQYKFAGGEYIQLIQIDNKEYAVLSAITWDANRREGQGIGHGLYELTCQGAKLVCDKSDLSIH